MPWYRGTCVTPSVDFISCDERRGAEWTPSPYHSSFCSLAGRGLMSEKERVGITPKSWTGQRHHGVLHLGKRWYVLSADIDDTGTARGVRLDGPYDDHATA